MQLRTMLIVIPLSLAGVPSGVHAAEDCAVTGLEGKGARVQRNGTWEELGTGPLAGADRVVETGPATRLEVSCDGGIVVTIGPDSHVDLGEFRTGPASSVFMQLVVGIMGIVAPPRAKGLLAVQTPVAIASVRSTEWLIEHDGTTAVFVRVGQVAVANATVEFLLGPGEGITLGRHEVIKPVGAWGAGRIREVNQVLGFGWD